MSHPLPPGGPPWLRLLAAAAVALVAAAEVAPARWRPRLAATARVLRALGR